MSPRRGPPKRRREAPGARGPPAGAHFVFSFLSFSGLRQQFSEYKRALPNQLFWGFLGFFDFWAVFGSLILFGFPQARPIVFIHFFGLHHFFHNKFFLFFQTFSLGQACRFHTLFFAFASCLLFIHDFLCQRPAHIFFFLAQAHCFHTFFFCFAFFLFFAYWSPKFWRKEQQKIMNRQPQHFEKKRIKHASSSKFLLPLCVPFWHFGSRSGVWVNII